MLCNDVMSHDISVMLQVYVEMLCQDTHYLCVELVFFYVLPFWVTTGFTGYDVMLICK